MHLVLDWYFRTAISNNTDISNRIVNSSVCWTGLADGTMKGCLPGGWLVSQIMDYLVQQ